MLDHIRPAIVSTLVFTVLLGLAYPLAVTGVARLAFPAQAEGSMIRQGSTIVGSALIAQGFAAPQYLHPRPSAAGKGYDAAASSGSNYGPLNPDLATRVKADAATIRAATSQQRVPADAVTTSASGLDPDISPAYAGLQVARIAQARAVPPREVQAVVDRFTTGRWLGFIGQPRVNVLLANRALDQRFPAARP